MKAGFFKDLSSKKKSLYGGNAAKKSQQSQNAPKSNFSGAQKKADFKGQWEDPRLLAVMVKVFQKLLDHKTMVDIDRRLRSGTGAKLMNYNCCPAPEGGEGGEGGEDGDSANRCADANCACCPAVPVVKPVEACEEIISDSEEGEAGDTGEVSKKGGTSMGIKIGMGAAGGSSEEDSAKSKEEKEKNDTPPQAPSGGANPRIHVEEPTDVVATHLKKFTSELELKLMVPVIMENVSQIFARVHQKGMKEGMKMDPEAEKMVIAFFFFNLTHSYRISS